MRRSDTLGVGKPELVRGALAKIKPELVFAAQFECRRQQDGENWRLAPLAIDGGAAGRRQRTLAELDESVQLIFVFHVAGQ